MDTCLVSEGGEYGYIDKTGRFVISPQFQGADSFSEGLAPVLFSDGTYGYIDSTGRTVAPYNIKGGRFSNGLAPVYASDGTSYIDKTGNTVIAPQKYVAYTDGSEEGLICVQLRASQKVGCMDKTGQFVIPAQFDDVHVYQGLFSVLIGDKSGWMDTTGNYVWRPTK